MVILLLGERMYLCYLNDGFGLLLIFFFSFSFLRNFILLYSGNCAVWASSGLFFAGLHKRARMFPKGSFFELFEYEYSKDPNNVNVVEYKLIDHANKAYAGRGDGFSIGSPLDIVRNVLYFNLHRFANCVVHVPNGEATAVVTR